MVGPQTSSIHMLTQVQIFMWIQNEQLEAQILWLVTSSMDGGESNEIMLIKGWEKIGLTRVWNDDFQLVALEANTTTPLFTIMLEIEKEIKIKYDSNPTSKRNYNHHGAMLTTNTSHNFKHNWVKAR
jgi:hypothetical protein